MHYLNNTIYQGWLTCNSRAACGSSKNYLWLSINVPEFSFHFCVIIFLKYILSFRTNKPTRKRPLGRPRRRWEDDIRMDLEEIGINAGNWVDSAQDRNYWRALVNAALNLRVP